MKPLKRKHVDVDIAEDMYTTPLITLTAPQTLAVEQFLSGSLLLCILFLLLLIRLSSPVRYEGILSREDHYDGSA